MPTRKQPSFFFVCFLFLISLGLVTQAGCPTPPANEATSEKTNEPAKETTTETTTEASEPPAERSSEPPPEPRPESKPEPRPEPRPEPKPEPRPEPRPEPKPEIVADASESSKESAIPEPSPETITEPTGPLPTVSITEPKSSDIVTGKISIKVTATLTGTFTIERVELHVNGQKALELFNPPYNFDYDTARLPDGSNKFKAIAFTSGLRQAEQEVSVTTTNKGPEITFTKPKENDSVTGSFDIEVSLKDVIPLKTGGVLLFVDGQSVSWTTTTPTYKVTVNPSGKAYDSLPLELRAENQKGIKSQKQIWISYDPLAGPKAAGDECDNADPQKRCIAGHSCLIIPTLDPKALCYKTCAVGGAPAQCPPTPGQSTRCEPAQMGTTRGACVNLPRPPGTIFSKCGGTQPCNANLLCVGVSGGDSFCLEVCTTLSQPCGTQGFSCLPINGGPCTTSAQCAAGMNCVNSQCTGGACIEKCEQSCTQDTECTPGQACVLGKCSAPFCGTYGKCTSVGLAFKVCI